MSKDMMQQQVRRLFRYYPKTGDLKYRVGPHQDHPIMMDAAGRVQLDGGRVLFLLAQEIAWLYHYGYLPQCGITFLRGKKLNIGNLGVKSYLEMTGQPIPCMAGVNYQIKGSSWQVCRQSPGSAKWTYVGADIHFLKACQIRVDYENRDEIREGLQDILDFYMLQNRMSDKILDV